MNEEALGTKWHEIYASDTLSHARRKKHSRKLSYSGILSEPRTARILEVACGQGESLDLLSEKGFTNLTGIDTQIPKADNNRRWQFVQSNALQLPFPQAAFDSIFCFHALHHLGGMNHVARFLTEAQRCLVPGGKIWLIDHYDSPWLRLAFLIMRSPLAELSKAGSLFRQQLQEEHAEIYSYLDVWPEPRKQILKSGFQKMKWRNGLFFFYFMGENPQ